MKAKQKHKQRVTKIYSKGGIHRSTVFHQEQGASLRVCRVLIPIERKPFHENKKA